MKKILLLVVLSICICGCEPSSIHHGRKAYKKYFDQTLKDPESFILYSEQAEEWGPHKAKFVLDYGANNSFGGKIRNSVTIITTEDSFVTIEEGDQAGIYPLK